MIKGLKNPVAIAAASSIIESDSGKKVITSSINAAKILLIIGGSVLAARYGWSQYKKLRADRYARKNVGNPNLIAASIIFNSFTRFEFPGVLGWLLPEIDISTNESALNNIASQVTNAKAVSDAYHKLFDRNLFIDTVNGLDTQELNQFWSLINSPLVNNETTLYPIGSKLWVADRSGITVNTAQQNTNGNWVGTNNLYGNFLHNKFIGEVIEAGVITADMVTNDTETLIGQNFYIVQEQKSHLQCLFSCEIGVVTQSQVINKFIR